MRRTMASAWHPKCHHFFFFCATMYPPCFDLRQRRVSGRRRHRHLYCTFNAISSHQLPRVQLYALSVLSTGNILLVLSIRKLCSRCPVCHILVCTMCAESRISLNRTDGKNASGSSSEDLHPASRFLSPPLVYYTYDSVLCGIVVFLVWISCPSITACSLSVHLLLFVEVQPTEVNPWLVTLKI